MALDTSGNERVDFVWGNMAIQPSNRPGTGAPEVVVASNVDQNKGWSGWSVYPSGDLQRQQTITLNNGIVQADLDADSHDISTWLWSNYPSYEPNTGYWD
jgi:hypothetical protein